MNIKSLWRGMRAAMGKRQATAETDPDFFALLPTLPNPDPILRKIGQADRVYASIMADPHVIGEVRSIRGEFRAMDYRVVTWDETNRRAQEARELCEWWIQRISPNPTADWLEIQWQMLSAIFYGHRVHELVWDTLDGAALPTQIIDVPGRRVGFSSDAEFMLRSKGHPQGELVDPYRFAVSRHMATMENPYGIALLSSCYWPWVFKNGGWQYFVKYCERHGLPWPVARYPDGTDDKDIDKLAVAIAAMIDDGFAVVPQGNEVELLVPTGSAGDLPQERLISLANREISKALTGQAMVGELQKVGARAASETAHERQKAIQDSDRDIAAATFGRIFRWITDFNLGMDVPAPELEFFKQEAAGKERAEVYRIAAQAGARPSKKAMLDELNIPAALDDEDALLPIPVAVPGVLTKPPGQPATAEFAAPGDAPPLSDDQVAAENAAIDAADAALANEVIEPIARMLAQFEQEGKTLVEFQAALGDMLGTMDIDTLRDVTDKALALAFAQGYADETAFKDN